MLAPARVMFPQAALPGTFDFGAIDILMKDVEPGEAVRNIRR
jgi:hypothetical protein